MPQIAQIAETYASQIFWLLIVFGLIYFVVGRMMVPQVLSTVDARDAQVSSDLAAAEAARRAADETEEAWRTRMATVRQEAQARLNEAKARALAASEERVKAADRANAARLDAAEQALREQTQGALAGVETAAAEAAQAIVTRLAGIAVDAPEASRAVREVLARG